MRPRAHRQAAAWFAEKLGRYKTNGRLFGSPMTPVLEVELMRSSVAGKLGGWETLAHLAPDLGLPPGVFTGLADRALEQLNPLERIHETVVSTPFRLGPKAT